MAAQAKQGRLISNTFNNVWKHPVTVNENHFVYKSLSNWAVNTAVGCSHACRFCYVPSASTNKLKAPLKAMGVDDPDAQWGEYAFPRMWDEEVFLRSLRKAEKTPVEKLARDGNRAVMLCTTTDPYQTVKDADSNKRLDFNTRRSLELLLKESTLNVRILTRSPLAKRDFELMKEFGPRLLFGMSLPTLDNRLARIYEPKAPAPSLRLTTLQAATDYGLRVYVAMAPTYPECDAADLLATLKEVRDLDPVTVFHEPINIRANNVARIQKHAASIGVSVDVSPFQSESAWRFYAMGQLLQVEDLATYLRIRQLHLWPDKSLGSRAALDLVRSLGWRTNHKDWLERWWNRISEWPLAI